MSEDGIDCGEVRFGPERTGLLGSVWLTQAHGRRRMRLGLELTPVIDFTLLLRWLVQNQSVIKAFWNDEVAVDELLERLLPVSRP